MPASPFGNPPAYTVAPQFAQQMYPSGYDPHQAGWPGQPSPDQRIAPQGGGFNFLSGQMGGDRVQQIMANHPDLMQKLSGFNMGGGNLMAQLQALRAQGHQQPQQHDAYNTGIVPPGMGSPRPAPSYGFQMPQQMPSQAPAPRPMSAAVMPQPGFAARRPNPLIQR